MADIVNLRTARKRRTRAEKQSRAEENRAFHGQTRGERDRARAERKEQLRHLEGHRRERDAGEDGR